MKSLKMDNEIKGLAKRELLGTYDLSFLEDLLFGGWSIERDTAQFIGKICEIFRPRHVLEFGSGLSTLILAQEASKGNIEKIWSIDHLKNFPGHPYNFLKKRNAPKKIIGGFL